MVLHRVCPVFPTLLSGVVSYPSSEKYLQFTQPRLKTQNKNHVSYNSSLVVNILGILPLVGQVDNFTLSCEMGHVIWTLIPRGRTGSAY